ncbi:MAG: hypothetical protein GT601_18560 [Acidaminobacter sp.]|nr:hypothetical protein [Acidaminobacter sp.]MZQ99673.1 hypothetical protein [Acidaminobacter sp.]
MTGSKAKEHSIQSSHYKEDMPMVDHRHILFSSVLGTPIELNEVTLTEAL